jgi:putative flippase GtrA
VRAREVASDELLRFAGVGVVSTLGYLFLFVAWRPLFGPLGANAMAMAIATLFNTAVHRELSQDRDGRTRHGHMIAVAGGLYALSLALTTLALFVAGWLAPGALWLELAAITVANALAATFRFTVLRAWIFRPLLLPTALYTEVSR